MIQNIILAYTGLRPWLLAGDVGVAWVPSINCRLACGPITFSLAAHSLLPAAALPPPLLAHSACSDRNHAA